MAWDDFLDDLQDKAEAAFSNVSSQLIDKGVQSLGFIKMGQAPKSNLTAQQVMEGQRGEPPSNVVAQQGPQSGFMSNIGSYLPYILIAAFVGIALFLRKK